MLFYPETDAIFPASSYGLAGPLASLRLKHWRRGIQDADYLALAATRDAAAVAALVQQMVPQALWELPITDPGDPTYYSGVGPSWSADPDAWEAARATLAALIEGAPAGLPHLVLVRTLESVVVIWDHRAMGWRLQQSTDLAVWTDVGATLADAGQSRAASQSSAPLPAPAPAIAEGRHLPGGWRGSRQPNAKGVSSSSSARRRRGRERSAGGRAVGARQFGRAMEHAWCSGALRARFLLVRRTWLNPCAAGRTPMGQPRLVPSALREVRAVATEPLALFQKHRNHQLMSKRRLNTFAEEDWQRLLEALLSTRNLIPVIGEELSRVQLPDDSEAAWPTLLTQELCDIGAIAPGHPLDWPNDERLRNPSNADQIADANASLLRRVLDGERRHRAGQPPQRSDLRLSESLRLLAKIGDFPLFATTAPDGLLFLALRIEAGDYDATIPLKPDWTQRVVPLRVRTSALPGEADLPSEQRPPGEHTPVYHFFGTLRGLPGECALSDSQRLEAIIGLAGGERDKGILFEFARSDILMLGTRLPDCLAAAFIRLVKGRALHEGATREIIATELPARPADPSLLEFLTKFGRTRLFETGDAAAFIRELHARWKRATDAPPAAAPSGLTDDLLQPPEQCVFLSYASEDRALARQIRDWMTAHGISAWLDKVRLEKGERWDEQLFYAVDKCRLFLPIVTAHSARPPDRPGGRFYLMEWDRASKRVPAQKGRSYLLPLNSGSLDPDATAYIERYFPSFKESEGFTSLDALLSAEGLAKLKAAYHKVAGTPRFLIGPATSAAP